MGPHPPTQLIPEETGQMLHTARILDPTDCADAALLDELRADPAIDFVDRYDRQVDELRRLRTNLDPELVGESRRWAYYSWRRTVVAVLGPRSFRAVRLDRNRNLITASEQARLGELSIGVAGLSVGHVIAHTLAAEGLCGALRLADFDSLDLSNLNRVPASVLDLGVNKAAVAARRIAELDPYLNVEVFDAGLTVDTVDEFLDGLNIVVEECDSLDMKAILREDARARRIPVLMATSDRGLVDVERFDLQPQRPILHGLLGELDVALLPGMSSREKIPHVLRHLEAGSLSARLAASAVEVDRTLSTWPQLAGDVILGATALAEAVRRIGLGEELRSGRVRLDAGLMLDQLSEPAMAKEPPEPIVSRAEPALSGVAGVIIAAAIRAPSGGNAQPWRIESGPGYLTIQLACEHTSTLDVGFRGSAVAIGAAVFNAKVAAASLQALGPVTLSENVDGVPLLATLQLRDATDLDLADLYEAMLARETNRRLETPRSIAAETINRLHTVAQREGARLHLLTGRQDIADASTILAATDRIRYLTPQLHTDMVSELRWPGDAQPDTGIDVRSLELDAGDLAVLDLLRRPDVMNRLASWNAGTALGEDTRRRVMASSAVAVMSVSGRTLRDYARGGSAVEAVWIAAQQSGLTVQPISPVFLYACDPADFIRLSAPFCRELGDLQAQFRVLLRIPADESLVLVLRLGAGSTASVRSRRSHDRFSIA